MLDVKDSLVKLQWTVEHHFLHIKNQHPFMRAWAIQYELAYTDFRVIQLALQLAGEDRHQLLADFTTSYDKLHDYEGAFANDGLEGFQAKYGDQLADYAAEVERFGGLLKQVQALQ